MVRMLQDNGYNPIVFDNLCTGKRSAVSKGVPFIKGDLRKPQDIKKIFSEYKIDAITHFAALIVVPESVVYPMKYYENNVMGSYNLIKASIEHKMRKFIFSSTAAVYGSPAKMPVTEDVPRLPENPYGTTKMIVEDILKDASHAYDFAYVALRYFNVDGAHPSGELGRTSHLERTHLIPNVFMAIKREKKDLTIFGEDYPTKDGTCVRDYIHVQDLCRAHLLALEYLEKGMTSAVFNLGNGNGYSVKEVVDTVEKVTGEKVPVKMGPRRPGDSACIVASHEKAKKMLGWEPEFGIEDIVSSAWKRELKMKK